MTEFMRASVKDVLEVFDQLKARNSDKDVVKLCSCLTDAMTLRQFVEFFEQPEMQELIRKHEKSVDEAEREKRAR